MKRFGFIVCVMIVVAALTVSASADWSIGEPNKWVQLPDKEPTGIDISVMTPVILADDFNCIETGDIDDIHIWGSWLNDYLPTSATGGADAANVQFRLSIYSDIPATADSHSMPGELLKSWDFAPHTFNVREYTTDVNEGWLNPPSQYSENADSIIWQYNFSMKDDPFEQKGTPEQPVVYWLAVSATVPTDPNALLGWKTSLDHWNDDATWLVPGAAWQELIYPDGHQYQGGSIDLAFVITPEPATIAILGLGSLTLIRTKRRM